MKQGCNTTMAKTFSHLIPKKRRSVTDGVLFSQGTTAKPGGTSNNNKSAPRGLQLYAIGGAKASKRSAAKRVKRYVDNANS